ncbi:MAG TPA: ATP-binding protein, partial [Bdellovibrionales bacterium]|nr:ATP-binding protein [Bdellovibrionales bacterium]
LYRVSKLLSSSDDLEKLFPQILSLCVGSFPFGTGVLVEKRGLKTSSVIWHADGVSAAQISAAAANAKRSFAFLTGAPETDAIHAQPNSPSQGNYLTLPLIVDNLPAFGVLQLDGSIPLSENDLEFVDALANLIAVTVDRNYKTDLEREVQDAEAKESSDKLKRSRAYVSNLEDERALRETFVSLLTHDLRAPLSAAKISAQLIQRQKGLSEAIQSLAARISSNITRADHMITDLLDANRVRSGEKLPLDIEEFDLSELVKETLQELTVIHGERFVFQNEDRVVGQWDRKYLRRIIENLASNAVKYGTPDTPITISLMRTKDKAVLDVHNSGESIAPADQITLFQQFRRTRKAVSGRQKGWGIGLTLVRGVVEAHGGTLSVESTPETGTVFGVYLPLDARPFSQGKAR